MKIRRLAGFLVGSVFAAALHAADLNVFAAASLSDALQEVAKGYEKASNDKVRINFAASSVLAQQIKHGAPADVFFSADEAKVDDLAKLELIDAGARRGVLSNTLVIVTNVRSGPALSSPTDLAKASIEHVALAEPQTVPAGIYAKEYLQKIQLWKKIAGKVVPTENVRACLAAVEAGNADAGFVYKTDAIISRKVKIAYEVSVADGPKISYPAALVKGSNNEAAAKRFLAYLDSAEARAVFAKFGFLPAP
ncbi:MAG TPA: molybdate ABC transporter substrate-binding protein [Opitutaceae bacterium]|nr:molybdate ABC transporter substrate-binding protein [Opitutaceae bacterium]